MSQDNMLNNTNQNDLSSPPQASEFNYPQQLPGLGNFAPMQHQSHQQAPQPESTSMNEIKRQLLQVGSSSGPSNALLLNPGSTGQLDPATSAFLAQLFMDSSRQSQGTTYSNANTMTNTSRLETPLAAPFMFAGPFSHSALSSVAPGTTTFSGVPQMSANTVSTAPAPSTVPVMSPAMMMSVLGDPRLFFAQNQLQQQQQQATASIGLAPPAPAPQAQQAPPEHQQGELPLPSPHSLFHRDGSRRMRGGVIEPFPEKLHRLLMEVEQAGRSDVISFVASGRAFAIHHPDKFFKEIVPLYFRQSRLSSFKRQLNLYGFELINTGPARGGYYHELFQKDRPELCRRMRRVAIKVASSTSNKARMPPPDARHDPLENDAKISLETLLSNDVVIAGNHHALLSNNSPSDDVPGLDYLV